MKKLFIFVLLAAIATLSIAKSTDDLPWINPFTATAIQKLFTTWRNDHLEIQEAINASISSQEQLQVQLAPEQIQRIKAAVKLEMLIEEFISENRNSSGQQVFIFGSDLLLTFPSQPGIEPIPYNPLDIKKIEIFIAELLLKDIVEFSQLTNDKHISDFLPPILNAIMTALEFHSKLLFSKLVFPLMHIAVLLNPLPEYQYSEQIIDGDLGPMKYLDILMENWGNTLESNSIRRIYYPETRDGIQKIVRLAATEGKKVRASGMRHTWNPWLWGVNGTMLPMPETSGSVDIFIAMVPNEVSDKLSYARGTTEAWKNRAKDLTTVEGPLEVWTENGKRKASIKVGGATLNEHLLEWIMGNQEWTMPVNTIMLLMSMGGTTSSICHGGGIQHKSLSDLIIALEYVDSQGNVQVVNDPELIKAASGAFGMLGIIVSMTLKLDEMSYARWGPRRITSPMEEYWSRPGTPLSNDSINMFENHYYSEWIAFPKHHMDGNGVLWQNVWQNDGLAEDSEVLIDFIEENYEISYQFLAQVANECFKVVLEAFDAEDFLYWLYGWMTGVGANLAMADLPDPVTTTLTEALHFQRGLHTLVEKAMEMNIPIPDDGTGHPDWSMVQKAWWAGQDVIKSYEDQGLYPIDYAMEMRLMAGSDVIMAPYYGNEFGTISIEVVSSTLIPKDLWEDFKITIATVWSELTDGQGQKLKARPHWAKEFPARVGDTDINTYLKTVYSEQMELYISALKTIITANGGNIEDTKFRFSNYFLDNFFEAQW